MKPVKIITVCVLAFCCIAAIPSHPFAQKNKLPKTVIIQQATNSQRYIFHAQYATPQSGRQRYLTSDYTLTVLKDSVLADLPYFGRAYTAPMNTADAGIHFTSAQFLYQVNDKKKGRWDIVIKPKDTKNGESLLMVIYDNGNASLMVTSNNRQTILFNGYIEPKK